MICYCVMYIFLLIYGKMCLNIRFVYYKKVYSILKLVVWNFLCIVKVIMIVRKMIFKYIMVIIFL